MKNRKKRIQLLSFFLTLSLVVMALGSLNAQGVLFQNTSGDTLVYIADEGTTGSLKIKPGVAPSNMTNKLYNLGGNLHWGNLPLSHMWNKNGSHVYYNEGKVGIGEMAPTADLEVNGIDGVIFEGTYGSGTIPALGAGTRMMWYPRKGALRAGGVDATQWDDTNIGEYSYALGYNNTASKLYSTAIGAYCTASGDRSIAIGNGAQATRGSSIAIGQSAESNAIHAIAMGKNVTASGAGAFASGAETTASGENAVAMGYMTKATGWRSLATGNESTASGPASTALGYTTTASGSRATSLGSETIASGNYSSAMGMEIEAAGEHTFAIALNDQNGTIVSQNNTMAIMGGKVGIGEIAPTRMLHVNGEMEVDGAIYAHDATGIGLVDDSGDFGIWVKDGGNVGVNTSNPTEKFVVKVGGTNWTSPHFAIQASSTTDQWGFTVGNLNNFFIGYNETSKLTFEPGGNVGIGTNSPGYLLEVAGTAGKPDGGSWSNSSDARLKAIQGYYSKGLDDIALLQPVKFNYKTGNPRSLPSDEDFIGFIAQEVQGVFPEAVTVGDDGYLDFNMHAVNVAMVNAIKELKVENDHLKREIEALKKMVNVLVEKKKPASDELN
jgi:hypothetical protein